MPVFVEFKSNTNHKDEFNLNEVNYSNNLKYFWTVNIKIFSQINVE